MGRNIFYYYVEPQESNAALVLSLNKKNRKNAWRNNLIKVWKLNFDLKLFSSQFMFSSQSTI